MTHHNDGYRAGYTRGRQDVQAEADGHNLRLPTHTGLVGQPPADLTPDQREQWIDGFLDGYADGRRQSVRGEAA